MVEFDELRHLWQSQAQPDSALALDGRAMGDVLRRFHRRQMIINCVRASLLVFVAIWAPLKVHLGLLGLLGMALMLTGLTAFLVVDWRNQVGIARLDFTKPSADFVDSSIQRLNDMRYPFRQTFWIFIVSAVAGLNLLWHPQHQVTWQRMVVAHVNATAFPFIAFWLGVRIRAKRFDLECRPIMEKLLSMKQAMHEGAR
jgi:hypothetical protein